MAVKYWNVNIPEDEYTEECPEYLLDVDHWDRAQLAVKDEDYDAMPWAEVKDIIANNRLETFKRVPSDLRRYRKYMAKIKQNYGSVMNFILKERVHWDDLTPKGLPFEYPEDYKILRNDWPYGIDTRIIHLVVWTKFGFEEDPETGDLTAPARKLIDDYVNKTFRDQENPGNVAWFKNWAALKSVHAVEHFHVMLFDPDPSFVEQITDRDISLQEKLQSSGAGGSKPT